MKHLLLTALLMIAVTVAQGMPATAPKSFRHQALFGQRAHPKLFALLFRADWCPTCRVLEPQYYPLEKSLDKKPILFVRFDFTNKETTMQSKALAARLGVGPIFRQYEGSTGFALLVRPSTKRIVGLITIAQTPRQMRAKFMQALTQ